MTKITFIKTPLSNDRGAQFAAFDGANPVSFRSFYRALENDAAVRQTVTNCLLTQGAPAFFWETPPATQATVDEPFEFVLIHGARLALMEPNARPFSPQFTANPHGEAIAFANLGRNAQLVVPRPLTGREDYAHLATFLREAPANQVDALWRLVAATFFRRLSDKPVWVSTAGMGVAWLHVRFDDRPKYYRHAPYRSGFGRKSERVYS